MPEDHNQLAVLTNRMENLANRFEKSVEQRIALNYQAKSQHQTLEKLERIIIGNGESGLSEQVRRLDDQVGSVVASQSRIVKMTNDTAHIVAGLVADKELETVKVKGRYDFYIAIGSALLSIFAILLQI